MQGFWADCGLFLLVFLRNCTLHFHFKLSVQKLPLPYRVLMLVYLTTFVPRLDSFSLSVSDVQDAYSPSCYECHDLFSLSFSEIFIRREVHTVILKAEFHFCLVASSCTQHRLKFTSSFFQNTCFMYLDYSRYSFIFSRK